MSKFEISENPTVENVDSIVKDAMEIKTVEQPKITGRTSVLKIMLSGEPFYHFSKGEFNEELATRQQDVVVGGKRFYKGLKNNSMHTRLRLSSLATQ